MTTPRFSVLATYLALFIGWITMPALAIVKVARAGMGIEHEQCWRRSSALAVLRSLAAGLLGRMHERFMALRRHALFEPIAVAIAVVAFVMHAHVFAAPFLMGSLAEGQHAGEFIVSERLGIGAPSRENVTVLSGQNITAGAVVGRVTRGIGRVSIPVVGGTPTGNGTVGQVFGGPEVQLGSYLATCTVAVANGGTFTVVCPDGNALPSLVMTPGAGGTTNYRSRHLNFTITDGSADFGVGDTFTFVVGTTAPTVQGGTGTGTISALALGPDAKTGNYRVICTTVVANGGVFQVFRGGKDFGESIGQVTLTPGSGGASAFESQQISFTITDATDFIVGDYFDVCVFNQLNGGKVVAWDPTTFDGRQTALGALFDSVNATSADTTGVVVCRDAEFLKSALQWGAAITASQQLSAYNDLLARGIVAR